MKPASLTLALSMLTVAAGGCGESPSGPQPILRENRAPQAHAGSDIALGLPNRSATLSGYATDSDGNVTSYSWSKVSGPDAYVLESPHLPNTLVTGLDLGSYQFELLVKDSYGLTGSDTVEVLVYEPRVSDNEFVFLRLTWSCPWECYTGVPAIYEYISPGTAFRVFVQEVGREEWIEALPEAQWSQGARYVWGLSDDYLYILLIDGWDDAVNVKITF